MLCGQFTDILLLIGQTDVSLGKCRNGTSDIAVPGARAPIHLFYHSLFLQHGEIAADRNFRTLECYT